MGPVLATTTGRAEGVELHVDAERVHAFLGLPFARPPIGPYRFRAPEAAGPWRGTRDATTFGPAAPQPRTDATSVIPGMAVGATDEDCLALNVWRPAGGRLDRPVMVWLHGGSFAMGSASLPTYDGARLAADGDVVVVSANYRLGALGFLSLPGRQANCGLLDQLLALQWVRHNAPALGGDPGNVTVFGESAGAGSLLHLLAAPRSRGLVHRAIAQSGATHLTLDRDHAAEVADRFLAALGDDSDDIERVPVERLLAAQQQVDSELGPQIGLMPFHPVADGDVVAAAPIDAMRSRQATPVDLLIGTTRDEMSLSLFFDERTLSLDAERLRGRIARYVAGRSRVEEPEAAVDRVLAAHEGGTPAAVWGAVRTFVELRRPAIRLAEANAAAGCRTYSYLFTWPAAAPNARLGACHAIDLPFTFGTFDRDGWDVFVGADDDAHALSAAVRGAWTAFARTGDPGWPAYDTGRRATRLLGRTCTTEADPEGEARRTWDDLLGA